MTELATKPLIEPDPDPASRAGTDTRTTAPPPPPLITEQQVLLGSAAALAGAEIPRRSLRDAVRTFFSSHSSPRPEGVPRHYPKHYTFIENAAMSREMYRL